MLISTSRYVYQQLQKLNLLDAILQANVCVVTDTCTYYGSLLKGYSGRVMTASAKWAYYAPGNLNIDVVFARLSDCIDSAVAGRVVIDESFWQH